MMSVPRSANPVAAKFATAKSLILLGIILVIHVVLGFRAIKALSPTFDEPLHLAAGYAYWKTGDYRVNGNHHPPLSSLVAAVPLLAVGPEMPVDDPLWLRPRWSMPLNQYTFANRFLYHNNSSVSAEKMMTAGRSAMLAASCLFLVGLFFSVRKVIGPVAGWTALGFAAVCPSFLAHGTLVTTDFLFAAFFFFFFVCFGQWQALSEKNRPLVGNESSHRLLWALAAGAALSLTFASKFSAVAIGPTLVLWAIGRRFRIRFRMGEVLCFVATAFGVLLLVYQVKDLPVFFSGLSASLNRVQTGRSSFLLGEHSTQGWWYYFPLAFLWKSPLPILIGMAGVFWAVLRIHYRIPWFFVLPPVVFFGLACVSKVQIGHRHILAVYPFVYALIGQWVQANWRFHRMRVGVMVLGALTILDIWTVAPDFLAYFNPLTPKRDRPYLYMTDSNVDWGQGMKALKRFVEEQQVGGIYLSYFGTAEPRAYGIRYISVASDTLPPFQDDDLDLRDERKVFIAVSATNLMSTYYADRTVFAWLTRREPHTVLARSLAVYDITGDVESHERLASIFTQMGKENIATAERQWAKDLSR